MSVSDEELLVASVGDEEAFAAFYRRYARPLAAFFKRRTGNAELAADLTAETFAEALASRRRFDPAKGTATGWLYGIARHKLARTLRHGRVEDRARRTLGMAPLALDDEAIELVMTTDGDVVQLRQRLPADQRAAIEARVGDEQEYEHIADTHTHVRGRDPKARVARPGESAAQAGRAEPMTDFFDELERELRWAYRRDTGRHARSRLPVGRRLPGLPATGLRTLAALALVVALVAVVLSVARNSDVERHAAPRPATGAKVVTDVEAGIRFSLDGRVLTVQLLPTVRTVSGARISATCGAKVATPTSDPRATILTRLWPTGQTSLSYGFPRDVSGWCRLEDQFGSFVAFAKFPGASPPLPLPGPRVRITETADNWARLLASSAQACNDYAGRTVCEQVNCRRVRGTLSEGCRPVSPRYAAEFRGVTVEEIAISGDRAAATFSNSGIVQLRRTATGEWLIDKLGPFGAVDSSK